MELHIWVLNIDLNEIIVGIIRALFYLLVDGYQSINNLISEYYLDNPMFKIILEFVPAILGISYPLIIQTISNLNDRYNSTHIIKQFKKEKLHRLFITILPISVFFTFLCFVLSLSVFLLAFISVILLLVVFFLYLNLLLKYQSAQDLFEWYNKRNRIDYYLDKRDKIESNSLQKYRILDSWHPIIDLFLYAIKNGDRELENNIKEQYIYKVFAFIQIIDQRDNEKVVYPIQIYNSSFDIVSAYIKTNEINYYQNFENFIGSIYFFESSRDERPHFIHKDSYLTIWRNIVLAIENERFDKIILFWKRAHQYCDMSLQTPASIFDEDYNETQKSEDNKKEVEIQKYLFVQFNTALGAYLLDKREFKTIKETWFFSQSSMPTYALFPNSVKEIITMFLAFDSYDVFNSKIIIAYWFKDLEYDCMGLKRDVRSVIREYFVLLFLRLYIVPHHHGIHPIQYFPSSPIEQPQKQKWLENLEVFNRILIKHLNDKELLTNLGLDKITPYWCLVKKLNYPLEYIDNFKLKLATDFKKDLEESELDDAKVTELKNKTIKAIADVYNDISRIGGIDVEKNERDSLSNHMEVIRGQSILQSREAFNINPSIHHINADSILGQIIQKDYYHHFLSKITSLKRNRKYKVPSAQLFDAVDKLKLPKEDYIIISFGIHLEYFRDFYKIPISAAINNEDFRYKSIPIYKFNIPYSFVFDSLFIISRKFFPMIKHKSYTEISDLSVKALAYWESMDEIDKKLHIHLKISELNTEAKIKEEYIKNGKSEEELKNMLEINIDFLGYIWFKKEAEIIEIKVSDTFQEGGEIDNIDDIKPIG